MFLLTNGKVHIHVDRVLYSLNSTYENPLALFKKRQYQAFELFSVALIRVFHSFATSPITLKISLKATEKI